MKEVFQKLTAWDNSFLNFIFRLRHSKVCERVFLIFTRMGDGYGYPLVPLALIGFGFELALRFMLAQLIAFSLERPLYWLIKNGIKRIRPFRVLANVSRRVIPPDQFSFPSGHTSAAFVMATLMGTYFPVLWVPALVWALLVGGSRLYLGVHYPSDVLAGMSLGILMALMGIFLSDLLLSAF